jgi:tRNA A-37 threonylcarbamoyl transferase component Bud32
MMAVRQLGKYRILERLGAGGMGTVYRASDEMLDREVAIKMLHPELAREADLVTRFRTEARALARLNHPRIATLHGLEQSGDDFYMVLEYVCGETLESLVQRGGSLPWRRAVEICMAILDALEHAHAMGVVHRDIKPGNVMLTHAGDVKVTDFGIARLVGRTRHTRTGVAIGTPAYMAPEQLRGEEVDRRADLYSVGAVLFELVTGTTAFDADSDWALLARLLHDPPPVPSSVAPNLPAAVDAVVLRAMAKQRADRFASAVDFRRALAELLEQIADEPVRAVQTTRLAAGGPETRFATLPSNRFNAGAADTRLAQTWPERPLPPGGNETRLGDAGQLEPERAGTVYPRHRVPSWLLDWRSYLAAAGVFLASAVGILALRNVLFPGDAPPPLVGEPFEAALPAGVVDEASASSRHLADGVVASAPTSVRDLSGDIIVIPPMDSATERSTRPPPPADQRRGAGGPPAGRAASRAAEAPPVGARDTAGGAGGLPTQREAPPATTESPARPAASDPSGAAASAVETCLAALRAGDAHAVERLFAGTAVASLVALVRERRFGAATLQSRSAPVARGDGSHVEFSAELQWRSPFGANRRQIIPFAAELALQNGGWRLVRCNMMSSASLR